MKGRKSFFILAGIILMLLGGFILLGKAKETHAFAGLPGGLVTSIGSCLSVLGPSVGIGYAQYYDCAVAPIVDETIKVADETLHQFTRIVASLEAEGQRILIQDSFDNLEKFMLQEVFGNSILPSMMLMSEQLTVVAMQQVQMIGMMLDAKHQLETQRLFQQLQAQAHKDYHPSEGMCTFGTTTRALAASNQVANFTQVVLSERIMERQLLGNDNAAAAGNDQASRLKQFVETYCNPKDNAKGLESICLDAKKNATATKPERWNKDIDYVRTVASPLTLDLEFNDATAPNTKAPEPSADEEDVFALSTYLYGHDTPPIVNNLINQRGDVTQKAEDYLNLRSVLAKRSVAQNSFSALTAMKAKGPDLLKEDDTSYAYIQNILKELGIRDEELPALIGDRPSYYAQMELLTKKIYQNPDFYTNLYDKPVNVNRKGAAVQAIGLMQNWDHFNAALRKEMLLSLILEMEVTKEHRRIIDRFNTAQRNRDLTTWDDYKELFEKN